MCVVCRMCVCVQVSSECVISRAITCIYTYTIYNNSAFSLTYRDTRCILWAAWKKILFVCRRQHNVKNRNLVWDVGIWRKIHRYMWYIRRVITNLWSMVGNVHYTHASHVHLQDRRRPTIAVFSNRASVRMRVCSIFHQIALAYIVDELLRCYAIRSWW